jgi:hypothetical protein
LSSELAGFVTHLHLSDSNPDSRGQLRSDTAPFRPTRDLFDKKHSFL